MHVTRASIARKPILHIHCKLVITLMMGAKQKECYNEMSVITKYTFHYSYSANSTSCDIQNNCNVFHTACCIRPISSAVHHSKLVI